MELPALIAVLVDAILIKCPEYDRVSVTVALESVFAGHPTLLGGNSISMLLGQNNDFTNASITIGDVHAGNKVHVTVTLPHPIDPLPAALAALASIPLKDVPKPRSDLPQASRLPFEASPHFVGREAELKALALAIGTAHPAVVMPAVATGLGGIGKTSLVTEFANRYGVYFHGGVFWLNCANADQVASQIAACAVGLKLDTTGLSLDEQVQRVLHAWQSPMPRLLIFDNCEDPAILDQWKPTVGGCRVLVTARSDQWPTLTQIRLGLLSSGESRDLLQRLCARLTDAEADAIAEDLGHLPLALHLAGSYLNTYNHHTVEEYRKDLTIAHRSLKGRGALPSPTRHELDVEAMFMLSFNQLDPTDALDALALGMLDGAAWCAPGVPIPRDLVLAFVPDETDGDDAVDALRRLQSLGLLDGADAVVLHRLLSQVVQARIGLLEVLKLVEEQINRWASRANGTGVPSSMLSLEPHLRHTTMRALDRGDAQAALLANSLGHTELIRGAFSQAQILFEGSAKINERVFSEVHPNTILSYSNLGMALQRQHMIDEAYPILKRVLAIREQVLGRKHPDTLQSMNNLGIILENKGDYRTATQILLRALFLSREVRGEHHLDTAQILNNLGLVLESQGTYAEAERLLTQALIIRKRILGARHFVTAQSLCNLGMLFKKQLVSQRIMEHLRFSGHLCGIVGFSRLSIRARIRKTLVLYIRAQRFLKRALNILQDIFGENHPETQMVAQNLRNLSGLSKRKAQKGRGHELR